MRKIFLALVVIVAMCEKEEKKAPPELFSFGDVKVTLDDFVKLLDAIPPLRRAQIMSSGMTDTILSIMEDALIVAYGRERGYSERPDIKMKVMSYEAKLLRDVIWNEDIKPYTKASYDEIEKFYKENLDKFRRSEVLRVLVITKKDLDELKNIRAEIKNVRDFREIAPKVSDDPMYDLGYVERKKLPEKVRNIKKSDISKPVKLDSKWAIYAIADVMEPGVWELRDVIDKAYLMLKKKKALERRRELTISALRTLNPYVNFELIEKRFGVTLSSELIEKRLGVSLR